MRTNGICMAENSAKTFLHAGRLNKAKHKLAPFVLLGGLLLSSPLRGQELKNDSINIAKEQSVESVNQDPKNKSGTNDLIWGSIAILLCAGLSYLGIKHSRGSEGAEAYNEFY